MALLTLTVTVEGGEEALRSVSALTRADRTAAHQEMAAGIEEVTRGYINALGGGRKGTAAKLGAASTGFYRKQGSLLQATGDATGVRLTMPRAPFSRAFRAYDLVPRSGSLLTIPLTAESYGKRAREFGGLKWRQFSDEDVAAGKSTHAGLVLGRPAPEKGGLFSALFRGARQVHQDQDRTLLPDDADWLDAMALGAVNFMDGRATA